MFCPSPDSSTQLAEERKRKGSSHKRKSSKKRKEKPSLESSSLFEDINAVQNHSVNSTQEIRENKQLKYRKDSEEIIKFKKQHNQIKKKIKANIALLKEYKSNNVNPETVTKIQKQFKMLNFVQDVVGVVKPLDHYVDNKRLLYKELFKIINKKQFKKMLPRNLKEYNAKQVKKWCHDEIQRASKSSLIAAMNGEETELLSSENEFLNENVEEDDIRDKNEIASSSTLTGVQSVDVSKENLNVIAENETGQSDDSQETEICEKANAEPGEKVASNESEVFEEMIKTPNQDELDQLMNCATSKSLKDLLNRNKSDAEIAPYQQQNDTNKLEETFQEINNEQTTENRNLKILELELRARALKSFIEAKEKHKTPEQTG